MGKIFGQLARITGVTFIRISPHEQRAFAGVIKDGIPNTVRRVASNLWIAPFGLATYLMMEWATEENYKTHRKNPMDFANDK